MQSLLRLEFLPNSYPHAVDIFNHVLWLRKNIFVIHPQIRNNLQ